MSTQHRGNIQNEITLETHDGLNNAQRVNVVAGGAGLATVQPLAAWPDPKTYIGLVTITGSLSAPSGNVTLDPGSKTQIVGNVTLSDPKGFIGLVTVVGSLSPAAGNVTLDAGSKTGIVGNVTLSDSKGFIGLVTANAVLQSNVTVTLGTKLDGTQDSVGITGNVTLSDSKGFIGLVSVGGGLVALAGNVTLSDAKTFIGLVTLGGGDAGVNSTTATQVDGTSNTSLRVPANAAGSAINYISFARVFNGTSWDRFPGNVSGAFSLNAGTNKTLVSLPIGFSVASQATIAVPTNANRIKVTQLVLNADATTSVRIKSGVTYLTGNASIGITLNPGGGWAMPGSPDSPSWIGLPSGALIVEKFDLTATSAKIGGGLVYYDEA